MSTIHTFVKLLIVFIVLSDFGDQLETFLHDVFADNLEDFILLQRFTGYIEGQIFRVDDTFHKVKIFGDKIFAVVHDEDPTDIKLDVVALFLGFKEIERCTVVLSIRATVRSKGTKIYRFGMKRIALNSN